MKAIISRFVSVAFVVFVFVASAGAQTPAGNSSARVALVIGNGAYQVNASRIRPTTRRTWPSCQCSAES